MMDFDMDLPFSFNEMDTATNTHSGLRNSKPQTLVSSTFLNFLSILKETVEFHCSLSLELIQERSGY